MKKFTELASTSLIPRLPRSVHLVILGAVAFESARSLLPPQSKRPLEELEGTERAGRIPETIDPT
jgi:hypothetical protein